MNYKPKYFYRSFLCTGLTNRNFNCVGNEINHLQEEGWEYVNSHEIAQISEDRMFPQQAIVMLIMRRPIEKKPNQKPNDMAFVDTFNDAA